MAERRRYNKRANVGKPAKPESSASSMAPHTDMELTTTDTLERDPRQPNTASQDPVEVLLSHLKLDDLDDEGSANDLAKDMNAGKLAKKKSSATPTTNTTSDTPTSTAIRPSRAKLPTTDTQCLFHADGSVVQKENIVLSMPPINSTGDIYHILAYLFLAECCIPRVILTHDGTDGAKKCAELCKAFATCFSLQLELQEIRSNGYRQNARQSATLDHFSSLDVRTIYIDQKACTTYIAHECYRHRRDKVTATLIGKFSHYTFQDTSIEGTSTKAASIEGTSTKVASIKAYAAYWVEKIKEQRDERAVFIMHIRRSSSANNDQNLDDTFHLNISKYLHSQNYSVCYIYADKKKKGFSCLVNKKNCLLISPFAPLIKTDKDHYTAMKKLGILKLSHKPSEDPYDYGKLLHLQLLLTLKEEEEAIQLKGIIGNTSGTLDLAAFIGHRVFNIHTLGPSPHQYQDCRVIMQQEFFTLGFYQKEHEEKLMQELQQWIEGQSPPAKKIDGIPDLKGEGFWQLFYARDVTNQDNKCPLTINIRQTIATEYYRKLPEGY